MSRWMRLHFLINFFRFHLLPGHSTNQFHRKHACRYAPNDSSSAARHSDCLEIMFLRLPNCEYVCCPISTIYYLTDCHFCDEQCARSDRHRIRHFPFKRQNACAECVCMCDELRAIQFRWFSPPNPAASVNCKSHLAWITHWMGWNEFQMPTTATMCFVISSPLYVRLGKWMNSFFGLANELQPHDSRKMANLNASAHRGFEWRTWPKMKCIRSEIEIDGTWERERERDIQTNIAMSKGQ